MWVRAGVGVMVTMRECGLEAAATATEGWRGDKKEMSIQSAVASRMDIVCQTVSYKSIMYILASVLGADVCSCADD